MSVWQPIETAPKDGTQVLLFFETSGVDIGKWHHSVRIVNDKVESDRAYWLASACGLSLNHEKPTHWMPLPEAPGTSSVKETPLDRIARALTTYMRFQYGENWETRRD